LNIQKLIQLPFRYKPWKPKHLSLITKDIFSLSSQPVQDHKSHLSACIDWLCTAQDIRMGKADNGSVSAGWSFEDGWLPGYPETTGYIIPTLWFFYVILVSFTIQTLHVICSLSRSEFNSTEDLNLYCISNGESTKSNEYRCKHVLEMVRFVPRAVTVPCSSILIGWAMSLRAVIGWIDVFVFVLWLSAPCRRLNNNHNNHKFLYRFPSHTKTTLMRRAFNGEPTKAAILDYL